MGNLSKMRWSVDYAAGAPDEYRCGTCGAHGVKLWREYNTFLSNQTLECARCAGESQGKDVSTIDADGKVGDDNIRCDQIGWRIPAVPTESGDTFWGYSSVPHAGIVWWRRLPSLTAEPKEPATPPEPAAPRFKVGDRALYQGEMVEVTDVSESTSGQFVGARWVAGGSADGLYGTLGCFAASLRPLPAAPAPEPDEAERCQRCGDALFACELPDSTCRFSVEARTFLEDHDLWGSEKKHQFTVSDVPGMPGGYDSVGDLATLLRDRERAAERRGWERAAQVADERARYWSAWSDCSGQRIGCKDVARVLRERGPR